MRSHHDMGGLPAAESTASEHDYALWSKRVHALTADVRYLVLPRRAADTDGWSEDRLAGLVGRDAMR